jgi:hypothetical protein
VFVGLGDRVQHFFVLWLLFPCQFLKPVLVQVLAGGGLADHRETSSEKLPVACKIRVTGMSGYLSQVCQGNYQQDTINSEYLTTGVIKLMSKASSHENSLIVGKVGMKCCKCNNV